MPATEILAQSSRQTIGALESGASEVTEISESGVPELRLVRDLPTARPGLTGHDHEAAVRSAIDAAARLASRRQPAIGLGEDVRFRGESNVGAALLIPDGIAHLSAWATDYQ